MNKIDRYLNYAYILGLITLQVVLIWVIVDDYDNWHGAISAFSNGLKGTPETFAQYGGTEKLKQAEINYWLELFELSLYIIIPLIIGFFRLNYPFKKWLNLLYYIIFGLYFCLFCFGIYIYIKR